jgi:hypothetical protein
MAFRSRQVSRRNNGAIDNPASARWTSHETGQVIVLTGRGVVRRSAVRQSRSMETLLIDKSSGSINGDDGWQLVRTIKQRGKLSTLNGSKLRGSFDHRQAPSVSCQSRAVSKIEIGKLYRVPKSTIRFLPIFAKIDPIRFPIQVSFVLYPEQRLLKFCL